MVIGLQKAKVKPKYLSARECGSNYGIFIQQTLQLDKVSELGICKGKWVYLKHKNEKLYYSSILFQILHQARQWAILYIVYKGP